MRGRSQVAVAVRGAVILSATVVAAGGLGRLAWPQVGQALATAAEGGAAGLAALRFDQLLGAACGAVALGCCAWLVTVAGLLTLEAVLEAPVGRAAPRSLRRATARCCPSSLRRLLLAACGVAMVTGLATGPASAEPSGLGDPGAAVARLARLRLTGLPLPDRSAGVVAPTPEVTVRPGDSLWAIAERWLPPDARTHDVAVATHALYRRNAARIGTDPDLILPGTQLRLPRLGTDQGKDQ